MTQALLWQDDIEHNDDYAKLCNALYERELNTLAQSTQSSIEGLQARLKSLPYYVKRTADHMTLSQPPLTLDVQNGSWSLKQSAKMPQLSNDMGAIAKWYQSTSLTLGLVIPIETQQGFELDSIDRIDHDNQRLRTNAHGWFGYSVASLKQDSQRSTKLVKPSKRAMMLACVGHRWINQHKVQPRRLPLRELLLSCSINWKNFKKTAPALR